MGGHIGDGNFHSMMVYRSEEEHAKVDEACRRLVQRAIELDGTCTYPIKLKRGLYTQTSDFICMVGTGEHGVGEGKRKYLVGELGQGTVDFLKTIKQTLDPFNLFNPGKVSARS